jgi:hypothetical protein
MKPYELQEMGDRAARPWWVAVGYGLHYVVEGVRSWIG